MLERQSRMGTGFGIRSSIGRGPIPHGRGMIHPWAKSGAAEQTRARAAKVDRRIGSPVTEETSVHATVAHQGTGYRVQGAEKRKKQIPRSARDDALGTPPRPVP